MKIIAINGSHRRGKNTAALLKTVLEEASAFGALTELIELTDFNINLCSSCNKCLRELKCSINDDMYALEEKLLTADGIILGSPVYWYNVTTLMKNFMDRTRYLHMKQNLLAGKVGAAVTNSGLRNGGQETTLRVMENFLQAHGLYIVDSRNQVGNVTSIGVTASLMGDFKENKVIWRKSIADDELAVVSCKQLGRNMIKLIEKLNK